MSALDLLLPGGLDQGAVGMLLATSFLSSYITAAFGIGGGAVLLAVMASLLPVYALIPVHGVIQFGSNVGRVLVLFRSVHWPALSGFAVGSVLGCALGGAIVVELPANVVQIGVGLFVIWTVFAKAPRWLTAMPLLTGLISSFLTMFFGATGLFVASYTKAFSLPRHAHVATHGMLMTLQHGLKILVFGILGFAFGEWGLFIVAMIALGFMGTVAGRYSLDLIDDKLFRRALDILLVAISLRLILAGIGVL